MTRSLLLVTCLLALSAAPARAQAPAPVAPAPAPAPVAPAPAPASEVPAKPPIPEWRLVLTNLLVVRLNPLGLEDQIRFGVQKKLYESDSRALRDNFVHLGVYPKLNPAFFKLGPSVELQPATVLNLRLGVEYVRYFGSFGLLQSFPTPASAYADTDLDRGKDAGQNYVTDALHVTFEPLLQAQVGPIAVRDKVSIEHWRADVRQGDRVFYESTLDTLVPASGFMLQNDLDVLYVVDRGYRFVAGLRYTYVRPLYDSTDFPRSATEGLDAFYANDAYRGNAHHRVGPLLAYTFFDDGYSRFNKPTAVLVVNWYASHRYRTGQDVSGAVPYVVMGFGFQSDFL